MKKFEILEHTADIRLKLTASTFQELFEVALLGMASIIKHDHYLITSKKHDIQKIITIQASDHIGLLVDFLSVVLTQAHINKAVFDQILCTSLTEKALQATIIGSTVESFDEDIKAVTYHEAYVDRLHDTTFEAQIIFDI